MRKLKNASKKVLAVFTAMALLLTISPSQNAFAAVSGSGLGTLVYNETREIANGVYLDKWQGKAADGTAKTAKTITFNPLSSDALIVASYGGKISGRSTLSNMSINEEAGGVSVIGGINGDFYTLATGVPIGMVIRDGVVKSWSTTDWNAIGFKSDGTTVVGKPGLILQASANGASVNINNFNKTQSEWGPFMYTADFGTTTGSTVDSLEIVVDVVMGELAVGGMLVGTVSSVNANTRATPIGANQIVLSAQLNKQGHYGLMQLNLKPGDELLLNVIDNENKWTGVTQAIGGKTVLIQNGAIVSGLSATDYNPTTAIGVKSNGDVVFLEVDGRNDTLGKGVTSSEAARFLFDLGCVNALMLDGGGSSAMVARMPGYKSPGLITTPSDGAERANANSLLLISKKSISIRDGLSSVGQAQLLHVYPQKAFALAGAPVSFTALATDESFMPVALPSNIVWGAAGVQIDATGQLIAPSQAGSYQIMVGSDTAIGQGEVTVVEYISTLKAAQSSYSVSPGSNVTLGVTATLNNNPVYAINSNFTWTVEGNIGTITADGVFTAAQGASGKGKVYAKRGSLTASFDIVITQAPVSLEDFENGSQWSATKVRANGAAASVTSDTSIVKFGSKALKIDYDFTLANGVEKGVAGVYLSRNPALVFNDNPVAIGMWVYGDNSKTWLRAKLKDGSGNSFDVDFTNDYNVATQTGGVDWTGWKYVEAKIPDGKKGPFTLETPLRIMVSRDEMRTKGTLYIDDIKAVYGASAIDGQAPVATWSAPLNNAVLTSNKTPYSVLLTDKTGIDAKSIQLTLDGANVTDFTLSPATGTSITLSGELGKTVPLADGLHKLVLSYTDTLGNKGSSTVNFTVSTGAAQIVATTSPTVKEGGTITTTLDVKNPKALKKIYLTFTYDSKNLELVDADPKTAGKQVALEDWIKKGKVIKNQVDEAKGQILIEVDGLSGLSTADLAKAVVMTFKAKSTLASDTVISTGTLAVITGSATQGQRFLLPSMTVAFDYGLIMNVTGLKSGETTVITITDSKGNPVSGASIELNGQGFWETDAEGKVTTKILTGLDVGMSVNLRAVKGDSVSKIYVFKVENE